MTEGMNRRELTKSIAQGAGSAATEDFGATLNESRSVNSERVLDTKDYTTEKYAFGFNILYTVVGHGEQNGKHVALIEFHKDLKMSSSLPELENMKAGTKFVLHDKGPRATFDESLLVLDEELPPQPKAPGASS